MVIWLHFIWALHWKDSILGKYLSKISAISLISTCNLPKIDAKWIKRINKFYVTKEPISKTKLERIKITFIFQASISIEIEDIKQSKRNGININKWQINKWEDNIKRQIPTNIFREIEILFKHFIKQILSWKQISNIK